MTDELKFDGGYIPTRKQWEELKTCCTWRWNGTGCVVKGTNGRSIVLPAAGYVDNLIGYLLLGDKPKAVGQFGVYWSSTASPNKIMNEKAVYSFVFFEQSSSIILQLSPKRISDCYSIRLVRGK